MHHNWNGKLCEGDVFPSHFTEEQKKECHKRYENIPEEFYTATGLPVATPQSVDDWLACVCPALDGIVDFQEIFSGSGRMSRGDLAADPTLGFPVDFRYGWDLRNPYHCSLLAHCARE